MLSAEIVSTDADVEAMSLVLLGGELTGAWRRFGRGDLAAVRFDPEGKIAAGPAVVRSAGGAPQLAADGTLYFTVEERLHAATLSRAFVLGGERIVLSPAPLALRSFAAADGLAIAEVQHGNQPSIESEVFAIASEGTARLITRAAPAQRESDVATGDRTTLVVREENRGGGLDRARTQIEATHADRATGIATDLVVAPSSLAQTRPSAAAVGDMYFVAWIEVSIPR